MPDLLVTPYLVLTAPVAVGPREMVPFKTFIGAGDEDERVYVDPVLTDAVTRLVEAYRLERTTAPLGAVVVPRDGCVGDAFERSAIPRLRRALLADNPLMVADDDE
jgi:hypothetical protein